MLFAMLVNEYRNYHFFTVLYFLAGRHLSAFLLRLIPYLEGGLNNADATIHLNQLIDCQ